MCIYLFTAGTCVSTVTQSIYMWLSVLCRCSIQSRIRDLHSTCTSKLFERFAESHFRCFTLSGLYAILLHNGLSQCGYVILPTGMSQTGYVIPKRTGLSQCGYAILLSNGLCQGGYIILLRNGLSRQRRLKNVSA